MIDNNSNVLEGNKVHVGTCHSTFRSTHSNTIMFELFLQNTHLFFNTEENGLFIRLAVMGPHTNAVFYCYLIMLKTAWYAINLYAIEQTNLRPTLV